MIKKVVDLVAVRASLARLDDLAREHPELTTKEAAERAAAWLAKQADDERRDDGKDEDPSAEDEDKGPEADG